MVAWFEKRDVREKKSVGGWPYTDSDRCGYKRILVAIDDNEWSYETVTQAVRLAHHASASLIILMVPSSPLLTYTPDGLGMANGLDTLVREGEAMLAWAGASAEYAGVPFSTIFKWGCTVPTILDVADREGCDLIVMGSPVRPAWEHVIKPCHATYVATRARQPVLVVKVRTPSGDR